MEDMDEIVQEFLVESHENLDQLDRDLVELEKDPRSRDLLGSIFRTIHTIKGTSGFLALSHLESLSHVGENLLSKLREGELDLTPEMISALLHLVDAVRSLLTSIEAHGTEGSPDHTELLATLTRLQTPGLAAPAEQAPAASVPAEQAPVAQPVHEPAVGAVSADVVADVVAEAEAVLELEVVEVAAAPVRKAPRKRASRAKTAEQAPVSENASAAAAPGNGALPAPRREAPTSPTSSTSPPPPLLGQILVNSGLVASDDVVVAVAEQRLGDDRPLGEILVDHGSASPHDVADALETQSESRRSVAESTIRVDVELLDSLMRLVGELVLTRNQIVQQVQHADDVSLQRASQRLNLIASELQEGVMKTRMQPIDNVWSKIPRVVRDLGVACGKRVRVEMEGRETELDKTVLEATKDPLVHLVRNAVDHGIETPEQRRAAGKPEEGLLSLRAFHEGGQVVIEIRDDGKGISPQVIAAKAVERGLVTADQLTRMSVREVLNLVFLPGFSTAAQVTNVSGRGVGMDVVKTNMEKIGGTVDLASEPGRGTTFRVKIPLTLAIIPALVVADRGDRYAIPQGSLLELVRIEASQAASAVEMIAGTPVYRLRGHLLPLVSLHQQFGGEGGVLAALEGREEGAMHIVVLQADDRQFGLVVEDVHDTQEIVVKPLGPQLKGLAVFAGATIMGDGRVALILDVMGLAQRSGVLSEVRERRLGEGEGGAAVEDDDATTLLVVAVGEDRRVAMPLADVARLEEIPASSLERGAGQEVLQYRNSILPLVRLDRLLGTPRLDLGDDELVPVVVCTYGGSTVGLVVQSILDIVHEQVVVGRAAPAPGVLGSVVLQGRVTDLLDVAAAVASVGGAPTTSLLALGSTR